MSNIVTEGPYVVYRLLENEDDDDALTLLTVRNTGNDMCDGVWIEAEGQSTRIVFDELPALIEALNEIREAYPT